MVTLQRIPRGSLNSLTVVVPNKMITVADIIRDSRHCEGRRRNNIETRKCKFGDRKIYSSLSSIKCWILGKLMIINFNKIRLVRAYLTDQRLL